MLPPGHIAGGFLAGKIASFWIPQLNQPEYLILSAWFGFMPDLDFFYAFYKKRKFIADNNINHHLYPTHAPLLYLAIYMAWITLFPGTWLVAITFILGTWSHFMLDTFTSDGLQWLYPFSRKLFGLNPDQKMRLQDKKFMEFWKDLLKQYSRLNSFKMESTVIIISILTLIFSR